MKKDTFGIKLLKEWESQALRYDLFRMLQEESHLLMVLPWSIALAEVGKGCKAEGKIPGMPSTEFLPGCENSHYEFRSLLGWNGKTWGWENFSKMIWGVFLWNFTMLSECQGSSSSEFDQNWKQCKILSTMTQKDMGFRWFHNVSSNY